MIFIDGTKATKTAATKTLPVGTRIRLRKNVIRPGAFFLAGTIATLSTNSPSPCATTEKGDKICWNLPTEAEAWEKFWADAEMAPATAPKKPQQPQQQNQQPQAQPSVHSNLPKPGSEFIFIREVKRPSLQVLPGERGTITQSSPSMICAKTPNAEVCWVFDQYEQFWKDVVPATLSGAGLAAAASSYLEIVKHVQVNTPAMEAQRAHLVALMASASPTDIAASQASIVAAAKQILGLYHGDYGKTLAQNPHLVSVLVDTADSAAMKLFREINYGLLSPEQAQKYVNKLTDWGYLDNAMPFILKTINKEGAQAIKPVFAKMATDISYEICIYGKPYSREEQYQRMAELGVTDMVSKELKKRLLNAGLPLLTQYPEQTAEAVAAQYGVQLSPQEAVETYRATMEHASLSDIRTVMSVPSPAKVAAVSKIMDNPSMAGFLTDAAVKLLSGQPLDRKEGWLLAPEMAEVRNKVVKHYVSSKNFAPLVKENPKKPLEQYLQENGIQLPDETIAKAYETAMDALVGGNAKDELIGELLSNATPLAQIGYTESLVDSNLVQNVLQELANGEALPKWTSHPIVKGAFDNARQMITDKDSPIFRKLFLSAYNIPNVEAVFSAMGLTPTEEQVTEAYHTIFMHNAGPHEYKKISSLMSNSPTPAAKKALASFMQTPDNAKDIVTPMLNYTIAHETPLPEWTQEEEFAGLFSVYTKAALKNPVSMREMLNKGWGKGLTIESLAKKLNVFLTDEELKATYQAALDKKYGQLDRQHVINCAMSPIGSEVLKEVGAETAPDKYFFLRSNMPEKAMADRFVEDWVYGSRNLSCQVMNSLIPHIIEGSEPTSVYFPKGDYPDDFNEGVLNNLINPVAREKMNSFVNKIYQNTQASLPELVNKDNTAHVNGNTVRLYRGVSSRVNIPSNLESWTSQKGTADGSFDGWDVLEADVPFDAILIMYKSKDWTSTSHLHEHEYIVLLNRLPFRSVRFPNQSKKKGRDWHPWDEVGPEGL